MPHKGSAVVIVPGGSQVGEGVKSKSPRSELSPRLDTFLQLRTKNDKTLYIEGSVLVERLGLELIIENTNLIQFGAKRGNI